MYVATSCLGTGTGGARCSWRASRGRWRWRSCWGRATRTRWRWPSVGHLLTIITTQAELTQCLLAAARRGDWAVVAVLVRAGAELDTQASVVLST